MNLAGAVATAWEALWHGPIGSLGQANSAVIHAVSSRVEFDGADTMGLPVSALVPLTMRRPRPCYCSVSTKYRPAGLAGSGR